MAKTHERSIDNAVTRRNKNQLVHTFTIKYDHANVILHNHSDIKKSPNSLNIAMLSPLLMCVVKCSFTIQKKYTSNK